MYSIIPLADMDKQSLFRLKGPRERRILISACRNETDRPEKCMEKGSILVGTRKSPSLLRTQDLELRARFGQGGDSL